VFVFSMAHLCTIVLAQLDYNQAIPLPFHYASKSYILPNIFVHYRAMAAKMAAPIIPAPTWTVFPAALDAVAMAAEEVAEPAAEPVAEAVAEAIDEAAVEAPAAELAEVLAPAAADDDAGAAAAEDDPAGAELPDDEPVPAWAQI
jgi:hypothetical protein